ncbi:MAG: AtpZ/AtpI family protein [Flavobacteriales bacterium]
MSAPPPRRPLRDAYGDYLRFMGLGLTMAAIVVAFTLLGRWLDGFTGWRSPAFTIGGALFGITGAMLHLFKETGKGRRSGR